MASKRVNKGKILFIAGLAIAAGKPNIVPLNTGSDTERGYPLCPPEGQQLLPHESHCNKYYLCENGRNLGAIDCVSPNLFSSSLQACTDTELADCILQSTESKPPSDKPVPPPKPPTDKPVPQPKPPTDKPVPPPKPPTDKPVPPPKPPTDKPVPPPKPPTDIPATPPKPPTDKPVPSPKPPTDKPVPPPKPPTDKPVPQPEVLPNGCPVDWDIHHLLPHETECHKFYYCVRGDKVERNCAPGTYFNYEIQVCDWPENVQCAIKGSGEENNGENNDLLPNGCPKDFDIHHLLPHESKCSKYYYCVHGDLVERECAPNTHFNPTLQVCDWPENAGCTNAGNESSEEDKEHGIDIDSGEGSGEESEEENWNSGEDNNGSGLFPNGCPKDIHIHHLLPHESVCSKYYYCVHGDLVERDCAPGTHFNPTLQVCDWPQNVDCVNAGNSEEDKGEIELLPNGCPKDFDIHHLLPHESKCSKYYYCVHGDLVERECAPNTHFNPTLQVCDWPENAGCDNGNNSNESSPGSNETGTGSNENGVDSEENNGGDGGVEWLPNGCPADFDVHHLLPHEKDCDKFYYCVLGNVVERDCHAGTHFNPKLQVCDWPQNAGCANAGGNGSGEESSGENKPDSGEVVIPNICDECNALPWAHETDCDKFWICKKGNPTLITCSEGLHFNKTTHTCDFICNAGCVRQTAQSTIVNDGVKIFLPWNRIDKQLENIFNAKFRD